MQIRDAMERADLAIILVSADFLTSSFIRYEGIPRFQERRAGDSIRFYFGIRREEKGSLKLDLQPDLYPDYGIVGGSDLSRISVAVF